MHMGLTGTVNQIISFAGPGRSTEGGGGGAWCFGCTYLLGNLLRYVLLCVRSVLLLYLAIQSVPETPNLLFVYFGLSLQAAKAQAIHYIPPYIVLYQRASYSIRTVYHFLDHRMYLTLWMY